MISHYNSFLWDTCPRSATNRLSMDYKDGLKTRFPLCLIQALRSLVPYGTLCLPYTQGAAADLVQHASKARWHTAVAVDNDCEQRQPRCKLPAEGLLMHGWLGSKHQIEEATAACNQFLCTVLACGWGQVSGWGTLVRQHFSCEPLCTTPRNHHAQPPTWPATPHDCHLSLLWCAIFPQVTTAVVVIALDLSEPHNVVTSALQWLAVVRKKLGATYGLFEKRGLPQLPQQLRSRQRNKVFGQLHQDAQLVDCPGRLFLVKHLDVS